MKKLSVGIIGYGRIGNEHAGWLERCAGAKPVAVADPTGARRAMAGKRGLKAYEKVDELLSDSAIDAVLVSTATSMHCEQALAALAAGKHVMIEKPMALDLAQAKRIVNEAMARQRIVSVFH